MSSDNEKASNMAAKMGANATEEDINNVANKMDGMKKGPLAKIWDKVVALWNGFKSPETPAYMKAIIIGGLIYMVSPIDLIPDVLPGGLIDDAGVIMMTFSKFLKLGSIGAIGLATVKLVKITVDNIRQYLKKHDPKVKYFKKVGKKINKNLKNGQYNTISCLDINKNEIKEMNFESDNQYSDLKDGVLYNV